MELVARELTNLGFSDKEAAVYLAALQIGLSSVQEISEKARVNRATTYLLIESLMKKGLISAFVKDGRKCFAAEAPERLLSLLRLQRQELEAKEKELEAALPKLQAIYNCEGSKPQIRYLEGVDGIASVMKFFEATEGEFIQIVNLNEVEKVRAFFRYQSKHQNNLSRHGVSYRLLAVVDEPDFSKVPKIPGGEVRLIPTDKFPLKGDISVRGNTVFMYSFQEQMMGIVITSADVANTIRQLFNIAWEGSGGYMSERR
jgi:sugar-specific transcriptional regulator TrmB